MQSYLQQPSSLFLNIDFAFKTAPLSCFDLILAHSLSSRPLFKDANCFPGIRQQEAIRYVISILIQNSDKIQPGEILYVS